MIKKLRRKFILSTMSILVVLFVVVLCILNYAFAQVGTEQTFAYLRQVAQQQNLPSAHGKALSVSEDIATLPQSVPGDAGKRPDRQEGLDANHAANPIYGVHLTADGQVTVIYAMTDSALDTTESALSVAVRAAAQNKPQGSIGRWRFCRTDSPEGGFIALMDASQSFETLMLQRLLMTSVAISGFVLVLLFFVSLWLSRFVTKPAEETFNKQKQFISDASHELKTPLSVISLNAEVLSQEIGSNKYMDYIRSEAGRMDKLIHQLLELSRMEDASRPLSKASFDLSKALFEVALPFESTAFEQKIAYDLDIRPNLFYMGEAESIKQLAAILLDNAFKHTPAEGQISLLCHEKGGRMQLVVQNTGSVIAPEDLPYIFERFYRCDKSRTESGSYGLGLAIAKSITTAHGGSLRAESCCDYTRFTAEL